MTTNIAKAGRRHCYWSVGAPLVRQLWVGSDSNTYLSMSRLGALAFDKAPDLPNSLDNGCLHNERRQRANS